MSGDLATVFDAHITEIRCYMLVHYILFIFKIFLWNIKKLNDVYKSINIYTDF